MAACTKYTMRFNTKGRNIANCTTDIDAYTALRYNKSVRPVDEIGYFYLFSILMQPKLIFDEIYSVGAYKRGRIYRFGPHRELNGIQEITKRKEADLCRMIRSLLCTGGESRLL